VRKMPGKLSTLVESLGGDLPQGTFGIGHTRWATLTHTWTARGTLSLFTTGSLRTTGS
jgi:glucosamine 6-phosphate synthetase-like amidotransferase/phosphosugar isomerase protein